MGGGGSDLRWPPRGLLTCPKDSPVGPREILISHLLSSHPTPPSATGLSLFLFFSA